MNKLRMKNFGLALAMTLSFAIYGCNDQPKVSALNPGAPDNGKVTNPGDGEITDPGTPPAVPGEVEVEDGLECEARATEEVPGESKNQGLILWTHIDGTCNKGAYSFSIRSWGPVFRFSSEEVKIHCHGDTVQSLDDYVGAYYGARAAAGFVKGGSYGHYHRKVSKDYGAARVHCNVTGHTDIDEDHWSFGLELGYGRMTITKNDVPGEPQPEPTPEPTSEPSPEPTDGPLPPEQPPAGPVEQ
jgi:hypothetical protein